ncbi:hypothetical protein [Ancylobacter rudongensis]|uniref:Uncharacterized protein n=1 Tax=Ancylobacter rudongensis TaxID=177413 RepID=A0A1G4USP2_9HYPH|nr:hypothetical protein [Ancylobacter rudongensis]SCW95809.1 hypothetical protein SAMN05660859_0124 [Ancylobacter rudongensis]
MNMKNVQRRYKRGRIVIGMVYKLKDGREVYLARRSQKHLFRNGEKTFSDALAMGKAAWAIDDDTLLRLRSEGVDWVGIYVTDSREFYLTTMAHYQDTRIAKVLNYEARGGSLQRYLPTEHFGYFARPTRIR